MSRSNYTDDVDQWDLIRWQGAVASAIRGKRGQAFLCEMRDALDAMPEKRLISGEIVCEVDCCAMGAVAIKRGIDVSKVDPEEPERVAEMFGVSTAIVREIANENDDFGAYNLGAKDDSVEEARWKYMRKWVEKHIAA